jgi:acyl carrier protein phosphodiesterase
MEGLAGRLYRGPTKGRFPAAIETGIIAHRKLDAYVQQKK